MAEALDLSSATQIGRWSAGGDSPPVAHHSSRLASKSASLAVDPELLIADLISLAIDFPHSIGCSPVSLLSVESHALGFAVFPSLRQWDLKKEPSSYTEACARPDSHVWHAAMDCELANLKEMRAFEECPLPPGKKPLDLKWVFAYKTDPDGNILVGKEKARLVAQGFHQHSEDFGETAAPVAKMTSIHIILAWAAVQDFEIFPFDCKTAFLHAHLCHDVYCQPVAGWSILVQGNVLKILAALYGLRQSAYEFYMLFYSLLSDLGMTRCDCNHGVFFGEWLVSPDPVSIPLPSDGSALILLIPIHVDDGLIVMNSLPLYQWFLHHLSERLHIVDLGPCSRFLSIVIVCDHVCHRLWLSSHVYIGELLADWNLTTCHHASTLLFTTSLPPHAPPNAIPDVSNADLKPKYQRLVGIWLLPPNLILPSLPCGLASSALFILVPISSPLNMSCATWLALAHWCWYMVMSSLWPLPHCRVICTIWAALMQIGLLMQVIVVASWAIVSSSRMLQSSIQVTRLQHILLTV